MVSFEDKDIALFLLKWGSDVRVLIAMVSLLIMLISLNIWLWQRRKNAPETVVEWTQNMEELEVDFPIPEGTTSRDIDCRIMPTSIHFAIRGQPEAMIKVKSVTFSHTPHVAQFRALPSAQGTLLKKVKSEECNWQLWPVGTPILNIWATHSNIHRAPLRLQERRRWLS